MRWGEFVVKKYEVVYTKRITQGLLLEALEKGIDLVRESDTQITTSMIEAMLCNTLKSSIDTKKDKADVVPATSAAARHKTKSITWGEESLLKGEFLELANECVQLKAHIQQLKQSKGENKQMVTLAAAGMNDNTDVDTGLSETAHTEFIVNNLHAAATDQSLPDTSGELDAQSQEPRLPNTELPTSPMTTAATNEQPIAPRQATPCSSISKSKAYALCGDIAARLFQEPKSVTWHEIEEWITTRVKRAFNKTA